jgi:hypothetical protein
LRRAGSPRRAHDPDPISDIMTNERTLNRRRTSARVRRIPRRRGGVAGIWGTLVVGLTTENHHRPPHAAHDHACTFGESHATRVTPLAASQYGQPAGSGGFIRTAPGELEPAGHQEPEAVGQEGLNQWPAGVVGATTRRHNAPKHSHQRRCRCGIGPYWGTQDDSDRRHPATSSPGPCIIGRCAVPSGDSTHDARSLTPTTQPERIKQPGHRDAFQGEHAAVIGAPVQHDPVTLTPDHQMARPAVNLARGRDLYP